MKSFGCLFLLLNTLLEAMSLPYFILTERSAKCLSITPTRNTKISMHYHFPDIVVMAEDMKDPNDAKEVSDEEAHFAADELSKRYNERYKRKMEMVKKLGKQMNDVSISMHQQFDSSMNSRNHRHRNTDTGERGTVRLREEIHEKHGTITFISSPRDDAPVEICIQSLSASPNTPARFSLNIDMQPYVDPAIEAAEHKARIEGTVSSMQLDLQGMERKIDDMMNLAMWAKEQEVTVHDRSVAINRAAMYWPMIHIAVLAVAGYAQASHVARFFKKHHIV